MKKLDLKKITSYLIITLLINIVFCIPLYKSTMFMGDDLIFHLSRIDGVLTALQDHQFPLKIYPYKNYGFGYASPLFYCDLFMIYPAILYKLGLSIVVSYKVLIFTVCYIAILTTLVTFNKMSSNGITAVFSTLVWTFSTYHLADVFSRNALGEIFAFCFIPVLIYNLYLFIVKDKNNWISIGVIFTLLLLSHNLSFIISCALFGIVLLISYKIVFEKDKLLAILKAIVLALGLSAFFLFPMIEQLFIQTYNSKLSVGGTFDLQVFSFKTLFTDLFMYYDKDPQTMYYTSGLVFIFLPFSILFVKDKNKEYKFFLKLFIFSLILILCTSDISPFYKIKIFEVIQFPWRLNIVVSNIMPFVICYAFDNLDNKKIKNLIIFVTALYLLINTTAYFISIANSDWTIPNNTTTDEIFNEQKYMKYHVGYPYNISELSGGEYLPYTHYFYYEEHSNRIMFAGPNTYWCNYERNGLEFTIYSDYEWAEQVMVPLSWYKGYACYEIDEKGKDIKEIEVYPDEYFRLVSFDIEPGEHIYKVYYKGTAIQTISLGISIVSFVYLGIVVYKKGKYEVY